MRSLDDILEEYEFLEGDERYRLLIELGRELEDMPDALKTDATLVQVSNRFYELAVQRTASGHYYQNAQGRWVKK